MTKTNIYLRLIALIAFFAMSVVGVWGQTTYVWDFTQMTTEKFEANTQIVSTPEGEYIIPLGTTLQKDGTNGYKIGTNYSESEPKYIGFTPTSSGELTIEGVLNGYMAIYNGDNNVIVNSNKITFDVTAGTLVKFCRTDGKVRITKVTFVADVVISEISPVTLSKTIAAADFNNNTYDLTTYLSDFTGTIKKNGTTFGQEFTLADVNTYSSGKITFSVPSDKQDLITVSNASGSIGTATLGSGTTTFTVPITITMNAGTHTVNNETVNHPAASVTLNLTVTYPVQHEFIMWTNSTWEPWYADQDGKVFPMNISTSTDLLVDNYFGNNYFFTFTDTQTNPSNWVHEHYYNNGARSAHDLSYDINSTAQNYLRTSGSGSTLKIQPIDNTPSGQTIRMNITLPEDQANALDYPVRSRIIPVDVTITGVENYGQMEVNKTGGYKRNPTLTLEDDVTITDFNDTHNFQVVKYFNNEHIHTSTLYSTKPSYSVVSGNSYLKVEDGTIKNTNTSGSDQAATLRLTFPNKDYDGYHFSNTICDVTVTVKASTKASVSSVTINNQNVAAYGVYNHPTATVNFSDNTTEEIAASQLTYTIADQSVVRIVNDMLFALPTSTSKSTTVTVSLPATVTHNGTTYDLPSQTATFTVNVSPKTALTPVAGHKKWVFGATATTSEEYEVHVTDKNSAPSDGLAWGLGLIDAVNISANYLYWRWFSHVRLCVNQPGLLKVKLVGCNSDNNKEAGGRSYLFFNGNTVEAKTALSSSTSEEQTYEINVSNNTEIAIQLLGDQHSRLYSVEWQPLTVTSVALTPNVNKAGVNLSENEVVGFSATATLNNGATVSVPLAITSANIGVATISSDGKIQPVAVGSTTISIAPGTFTYNGTTLALTSEQQEALTKTVTLDVIADVSADDLTPVQENTVWDFANKSNCTYDNTTNWSEVYASKTIMKNMLFLKSRTATNVTSVANGRVAFPKAMSVTNGVPDQGVAFKVNGSGTVKIHQSTNSGRSITLSTANGFTATASTTPNTSYIEVKYTQKTPTTIYLYVPNTAFNATKIEWIQDTDPITTITSGGNSIEPNSQGIYALSTTSTSVTVAVNVRVTGSTLKLSNYLTSATGTPSSWTDTTSPITLAAPSTPGVTWYYKVKVVPSSSSAPTRAAASEGEDTYIFAVSTIDGGGFDNATWVTGSDELVGKIPTGWTLHYDNASHDDTPNTEFVTEGTESSGSRLFKFASGGLVQYGFYLADRTNGATQFMKIDPDNENAKTLDLSAYKGKTVRFSVLASSWQNPNHKITVQIQDSYTEGAPDVANVIDAILTKCIPNQDTPVIATYINKVELPEFIVNDNNYWLKIHSSNGGWDGIVVWGYMVEEADEDGLYVQSTWKKWNLGSDYGWDSDKLSTGQLNDNIKGFETSNKQFTVNATNLYLANSADVTNNIPQQGFAFIVDKPGKIIVNAASSGDSGRTINVQQGSNNSTKLALSGRVNGNTTYFNVETRVDVREETKIYIYNSGGGTYFSSIEWIPDVYTTTASITALDHSLKVGETEQLDWTTDIGYNQGVVWTSSNIAIATVDQSGKVTAVSGGNSGHATVTITVTVKKSATETIQATAVITVQDLEQTTAATTWSAGWGSKDHQYQSNVLLYSNKVKLYGTSSKYWKVVENGSERGINSGGSGTWSNSNPNERILEVWVNGSGRLSAKVADSGGNVATGKYIAVTAGGNADNLGNLYATKVNLDQNDAQHVDYKGSSNTHLFLTPKDNVNLYALQWETGLFPEIDQTSGDNMNMVVSGGTTLSFDAKYNGKTVNGNWQITLVSQTPGDPTASSNAIFTTAPSSNTNSITLTPATYGRAVLKVKFTPTDAGYFDVEKEVTLVIKGKQPTITYDTSVALSITVGAKSTNSVNQLVTVTDGELNLLTEGRGRLVYTTTPEFEIVPYDPATSASNKYAYGYIIGRKVGIGTLTITWEPLGEYRKTYQSVTWTSNGNPSIPVTVNKGTLTMKFEPTFGTVAAGKTMVPPVTFTNAMGEEVVGLTSTFEFSSATHADMDNSIVEMSARKTTITGLKASVDKFAYVIAELKDDPNYNYAKTNVPENGAAKEFKIQVDEPRNGKLDIIEDKGDYISPNFADYWWYDEAGGSDNIRNVNSIEFTTRHSYLSGDDYFRFYASTNDDLVNDGTVKGLLMKEPASWLEFYLRGSGTLKIDYSAITDRRLEVWAIPADKYDTPDSDGNYLPDPTLDTEGAHLVGTVTCKSNLHSTTYDLKEPGRNYYFLKTAGGDIYLANIEIVNFGTKPVIELNPEEFTLTNSSPTIRLMDVIERFPASTELETATLSFGKTIAYHTYTYDQNRDDQTGQTKYDITNPVFTWESDDPDIVSVETNTGLLIPNSTGRAKIYFVLTAGTITRSGNTDIPYGAQRQEFYVNVSGNLVDVVFYNNNKELTEYYYSTASGSNSFKFTPRITKHADGTDVTSDFTITYSVKKEDGTPFDKASVSSDGTVTFTSGATFAEGEKFRVVVDCTSDDYISQRAFYTVIITNAKLTKVNVEIAAIEGSIKELTDVPTLKITENGADVYDASHEYLARMGWERDGSKTFTGTGESGFLRDRIDFPYTFTFTIPDYNSNLAMRLKVSDTQPDPSTSASVEWDKTVTVGTNRLEYTIQNTSIIKIENGQQTNDLIANKKYLWLNVTDGTTERNSYYLINFLAPPKITVSGTPQNSYRTVTIQTQNGATDAGARSSWSKGTYSWREGFAYTLDTTTPTESSDILGTQQLDGGTFLKYTGNTKNIEESSIILACEVIKNTNGYKDGTTVFLTAPCKTVPVYLVDDDVFYVNSQSVCDSKVKVSTNETRNILNLPDDKTKNLRIMFGVDKAYIYRPTGSDITDRQNDALVWRRGGNAVSDWSISESSIFSPIDVYESYASFNNNVVTSLIPDGADENQYGIANPWTEYNNMIGGPGTENGGLYLTPISGDFFRFEPEYNGVLSVWVRQNGATASGAGKTFDPGWEHTETDAKQIGKYLAKADLDRRPVYVMDEEGVIMQRNTRSYTPFDYLNINGVVADVSGQSICGFDLSEAWYYNLKMMDLWKTDRTTYQSYAAKSSNKFSENGSEITEGGAYYKVMQFYATRLNLDMNKQIDAAYPLTEIVYCDNDGEDGTQGSFAKYGYEIPNPNYVRYRFPVKAGKSYYIGGRGTKNGFAAVKFEKHGNNTPTVKTLDGNATTVGSNAWLTDGTVKAGDMLTVTLNRTFTAKHLHPIVLPFSVSESKLMEIFGNDVKVIFLDEAMGYDYKNRPAVQGQTLVLTKHFYQMIYANTPCILIPGDNFGTKTSVTFNNVTFAGANIIEKNISSDGKFKVVGSYEPTTAADNGAMYFINHTMKDGQEIAQLCRHKAGVPMKATRVWISEGGNVSNAAPLRRVGFASFDGDEIDDISALGVTQDKMEEDLYQEGIDSVADPNVYNMQGIVVGTKDDLGKLPAGIYIYNKEKLQIKR